MHLYWESLSDFQSSPNILTNPKCLTSYYEIEPPVAAPLASHYEIELFSALPLTSHYEWPRRRLKFLSLFWMFQKMTPPEAENFELFQPIYSQGCSLAIANRIWDPKKFLAPTGARGSLKNLRNSKKALKNLGFQKGVPPHHAGVFPVPNSGYRQISEN